ncbi:MAG: AAA family ATPase [Rikenellaceae bacterium]|jgi:hypothetical protein|nr:AAA family ATPase [Rikenellaceae bacterium]
MYIERTLSRVIAEATETFPVVLLTGARQVGKTTVFERCKEPERRYVTLDDPQVRGLAKSDPSLFLQIYKPPLLIDEIQYAPELFPYIKMSVDGLRQKGMFWLTGSQPFNLMKGAPKALPKGSPLWNCRACRNPRKTDWLADLSCLICFSQTIARQWIFTVCIDGKTQYKASEIEQFMWCKGKIALPVEKQ